jgi:hypothetical protein
LRGWCGERRQGRSIGKPNSIRVETVEEKLTERRRLLRAPEEGGIANRATAKPVAGKQKAPHGAGLFRQEEDQIT